MCALRTMLSHVSQVYDHFLTIYLMLFDDDSDDAVVAAAAFYVTDVTCFNTYYLRTYIFL